jgi:hypothetical protein
MNDKKDEQREIKESREAKPPEGDEPPTPNRQSKEKTK